MMLIHTSNQDVVPQASMDIYFGQEEHCFEETRSTLETLIEKDFEESLFLKKHLFGFQWQAM